MYILVVGLPFGVLHYNVNHCVCLKLRYSVLLKVCFLKRGVGRKQSNLWVKGKDPEPASQP